MKGSLVLAAVCIAASCAHAAVPVQDLFAPHPLPASRLVRDIRHLQPQEAQEESAWKSAKSRTKWHLRMKHGDVLKQELESKSQLAGEKKAAKKEVKKAVAPPAVAPKQAKQPVHFGDTITLRNVYNNYVIVSEAGFVHSGGYLGQNDRIRLVSPKGQAGIINYGDQVSLVGMNNRYFSMVPGSSGKITCRTAKITSMATFEIFGGSGPVMKEDNVAFKTAYGYLTATPSGLRGTGKTVTALQKYFVGIPGKEVGLAARPGLSYGMEITLKNEFNEFLQADRNGWVHVLPANGEWDKFSVLSPVHKTGHVSYGDAIMLRSHNGKLMLTDPNSMYNLQATELIANEEAIFMIVGGVGVVHNEQHVALRSPHKGYIVAEHGGNRAKVAADGHFYRGHNFQLHFDLHQAA